MTYIPAMTDSVATSTAPGIKFLKMHGLGNDFVVIDARHGENPVTPRLAQALGDRNRGIGFDQLAVITQGPDTQNRISFWNSDGTTANACGNATRCVARLLMDETGDTSLTLKSGRGDLHAQSTSDGQVRVNMGQPQQDWQEIPLSGPMDLDDLPLAGRPGAIGMGNPHCVFVVDHVADVDVEGTGAKIEIDPLFPQKTNVEFVEVLDRQTIRMRVWERGGMVTLACGSGACAAAVVTARKGLTDRRVTVILDGGPLLIEWEDDGVWMTGPTQLVFEGELSPQFLERIQ